MPRPLRISTGAGLATLREYTDAQLEYVVYILQLAYADQLNAGGKGYIYQGLGGTRIDSVTVKDTVATQVTNSNPSPGNQPGSSQWPAYPDIGTADDGEFPYGQDRTFPSFPSDADLDQYGYVVLDGSNNLKVESDEATWNLANTIISNAVTEIQTGNELGSYRVSESAPTTGTAGTWTDKGTFFKDDRYDNVGETTFKLWLKTSLTTPPTNGSSLSPIGITGSADGNLIEKQANSTFANLYADVLLPILTRRLDNSDLIYTVDGSSGSNNRGSFTDTRFNQEVESQFKGGSGSNQVYYRRATPDTSGTTTTVNTYYLNMSG